MPRPQPDQDERLLDANECAKRACVHVSAWWGIARDNLCLKRGRVERAGRTLWLQSAVTRYLRSLAGKPYVGPRRGEAGRAALRARMQGNAEVTA
jgi:hypothetical protein